MALKQNKLGRGVTTCSVKKESTAILYILIHCVTTFQPMNVENVTSHYSHGENVGQFDCRALRDCIVWEVWSAEDYTSKGKRAPKRSALEG